MEFLLFLWDELDDWMGACRHMASSAAGEVAGLTAQMALLASALGEWVTLSHSRVIAALHAAFQGQ